MLNHLILKTPAPAHNFNKKNPRNLLIQKQSQDQQSKDLYLENGEVSYYSLSKYLFLPLCSVRFYLYILNISTKVTA